MANSIKANEVSNIVSSLIDSKAYKSRDCELPPVLQNCSMHFLASISQRIIKEILPDKSCIIRTSSSIKTHNDKGSISSVNKPNQYLFHTIDSSPWATIDLGRTIESRDHVYLYNRCHHKEISERIVGCQLYLSLNGETWHPSVSDFDSEQIYEHKEICVSSDQSFRFLRICRQEGAHPIHLSQITIGKPLSWIKDLMLFLNKVFATRYEAALSPCGSVVENESWDCYMNFRAIQANGEVSISINYPGRFSNLLIELANAIHVAQKTGFNVIYLPDHERSRFLFPNSTQILCSKFPVIIKIGQPQGVSLCGSFFHTRQLPIIYRDHPGLRTTVQSFKHATDFCAKPDNTNSRLLTIHIRSGDIFETDIHSGYGQPPLAFYIKAISHFNPEKIQLVFENYSNPAINYLIAYLECSHIAYEIQSSLDLREDIRVLAQARALVIGMGTFARGVLCFNDVIKSLYVFQYAPPAEILPRDFNIETECHKIIDTKGEFIQKIMSGNWENSEGQRNLMITYPEQNLSIAT